jgi:hypothetical protein
VKHLLYSEKYTIEGARQKIDEHRKSGALRGHARVALSVEALSDMERQLEQTLRVLDGTSPVPPPEPPPEGGK